MLSLDIFNDRMFEAVELKEIVSELDPVPTFFGDLGLFVDDPIRTDHVAIVKDVQNPLVLIPTSERGAPFPQSKRSGRTSQNFYSKRIGREDKVKSSELLNVIGPNFPNDLALARAAEEVTKRLADIYRHANLTMEYARLKVATTGVWRDADNSAIEDWYAQFGYVAPSAISLDLTPATNTNLREWIFTNIALPMQNSLKNRWVPRRTQIHAVVGDTFWPKLITHPKVERQYEGWAGATELGREVAVGGGFPFGGVVWHHYTGTLDGTTVDIAANAAHFFPVGAEDAFKRYLSPGENFDDLGELGEEWYPIVQPDPETAKNRFVEISLATYPIFMCLVPNALLKAVHT